MVPEAYEPAMSVIPAWTLKIIRFHFQKKKIVKNKKNRVQVEVLDIFVLHFGPTRFLFSRPKIINKNNASQIIRNYIELRTFECSGVKLFP